jgi:hypothetical protein
LGRWQKLFEKSFFPSPQAPHPFTKTFLSSDCGRNQMISQKGLERVGVRGREEPFLKRFSLLRGQDFQIVKQNWSCEK